MVERTRIGPGFKSLTVLLVIASVYFLACPTLTSAQTVNTAEALAVGDAHSCIIVTGGGVKCWGAQGFFNFRLGDGTTSNRNLAIGVLGLGTQPGKGRAEIATEDQEGGGDERLQSQNPRKTEIKLIGQIADRKSQIFPLPYEAPKVLT